MTTGIAIIAVGAVAIVWALMVGSHMLPVARQQDLLTAIIAGTVAWGITHALKLALSG